MPVQWHPKSMCVRMSVVSTAVLNFQASASNSFMAAMPSHVAASLISTWSPLHSRWKISFRNLVRFAAWPIKAVQRKIWKLDRLSFYRLFLGCCPALGDAGFLVEGLSQVSSYFNHFHHVQSCSNIHWPPKNAGSVSWVLRMINSVVHWCPIFGPHPRTFKGVARLFWFQRQAR